MNNTQSQKQQPPFPNKYQVRLVGSSDSKPCIICFKPSTTVLLADGNGDFFYTCQQHLQDEQFANAIHPQEYIDLVNSQKELTFKKSQLEKDIELVKPYIWNKVTEYWKDNKKKDGKEEGSKYEKFKNELQEVIDDLEKKTKSILEFKFKQYKLNQDIYKNRLMNYQKKVYGQQRASNIQKDGFFPSAPSHNLE